MSIILGRIDYRLLHGIVATMWAPQSGAQRVMVIDDKTANDPSILKERLIKRKSLSIGLDKAIQFYEQSDSKNIQYVLDSKQCPNIEIELSTR